MDLATFEKPLIMGHRGFQARYPENTMVSFLAAVDAGAQFVELDVTLTRDNQVVVMHDDTVDRTTDGRAGCLILTLTHLNDWMPEAGFTPVLPEKASLLWMRCWKKWLPGRTSISK